MKYLLLSELFGLRKVELLLYEYAIFNPQFHSSLARQKLKVKAGKWFHVLFRMRLYFAALQHGMVQFFFNAYDVLYDFILRMLQ